MPDYIPPHRIIIAGTVSACGFESGSKGKRSSLLIQSHAAALMAGIEAHHLSAAVLKFAGDLTHARAVVAMLVIYGEDIARRDRWKNNDGQVRRLSLIAVMELADPKKYGSDKAKAIAFGVSSSQWSSCWKRRYDAIYSQAESWCAIAVDELKRKQGRRP